MKLEVPSAAVAMLLLGSACPAGRTTSVSAGEARPSGRTFALQLLGERAYRECRDDSCVRDALARCTYAHLEERFSTMEGDPVVHDYFVVPEGDGCELTLVRDRTADRWGGCEVDRIRCPTLEAANADDPEAKGCSPREVLYQAPSCPEPGSQ